MPTAAPLRKPEWLKIRPPSGGNFLALQLETVSRALSHLQALGLIEIARRQIRIVDPDGLRALMSASRLH